MECTLHCVINTLHLLIHHHSSLSGCKSVRKGPLISLQWILILSTRSSLSPTKHPTTMIQESSSVHPFHDHNYIPRIETRSWMWSMQLPLLISLISLSTHGLAALPVGFVSRADDRTRDSPLSHLRRLGTVRDWDWNYRGAGGEGARLRSD